eukprot:tig00000865_g5095.t1
MRGPAGDLQAAKTARGRWQVRAQVNGKLRAQLQVSPTAGKEEVLAAAKAEPNVAKFLDGKAIKKEVFVPGKLVNFVAA